MGTLFIEMVVTHHLKRDSSREQVKNLTEVVKVLPFMSDSDFNCLISDVSHLTSFIKLVHHETNFA